MEAVRSWKTACDFLPAIDLCWVVVLSRSWGNVRILGNVCIRMQTLHAAADITIYHNKTRTTRRISFCTHPLIWSSRFYLGFYLLLCVYLFQFMDSCFQFPCVDAVTAWTDMPALTVANFSDASSFLALTWYLFAGFRADHLFALFLLICMLQLSSLLLWLAPPNARIKVLKAVQYGFTRVDHCTLRPHLMRDPSSSWRGVYVVISSVSCSIQLGSVIMAAYKIARGRELLFGMTPWKGWPLKTNPVAGRNLVGTVHITINLAALQFLSMSENIVGLCKWFAVTRVLSNRRCRGAGRGSSPGASGRLGCFLLGPTWSAEFISNCRWLRPWTSGELRGRKSLATAPALSCRLSSPVIGLF